MRTLIIGGYGTIGQKVAAHFSEQHEVLLASRRRGDVQVDIADSTSIQRMYETIGPLDAVICTAGEAKWDYLDQLSEADFNIGLRSKLMGQVNLVRLGRKHLNPNGSFTLSTGILADDPVVMTTSAALVNGAIHSFVKAAALEMENGQRVNAVCAGLVEDSAEKYADYFPGYDPVPMAKVVNAFVKSVMGRNNGAIIRVKA